MKKALILFFILLSVFVYAEKKDKPEEKNYGYVLSQGSALIIGNDIPKARDEAVKDAQVRAIETVLGAFISSKEEINSMILERDDLYKESMGYITEYEIVEGSEKITETETARFLGITIRAKVTAGKLFDDINRIGEIYRKISKPKFSILVTENNNSGIDLRDEIESKIITDLQKMNFDIQLADRGKTDLIQSGSLYDTLKSEGVKILIRINADVTSVSQFFVTNSAECSLTATLVDLYSGQPYYTDTVVGHSSVSSDRTATVLEAAKDAVKKLFAKDKTEKLKYALCNRWVEIYNCHTFRFTVKGMKYSDIKPFLANLSRTDRFFIRYDKPKYISGTAIFAVTTRTDPEYFCEIIEKTETDGKKVFLDNVDFDTEIIEGTFR